MQQRRHRGFRQRHGHGSLLCLSRGRQQPAGPALPEQRVGHFVAAAAPFGAEGPTGPKVGIGESVVVSDYDANGWVDLFVTNGLHLYPALRGFTSGGPDKLFRNLGVGNR